MPSKKGKDRTVVPERVDRAKNPKIKYGDMRVVRVRARFIRPFMGGQATGHDDPTQELYKDEKGNYIIPGRSLRAMLREGSYHIDMSGTETTHVSTQQAIIRLNGSKVERVTNIPILSRTGGKGLLNAEVITTGAEFETTFAVPTKFISIPKFLLKG